MSSSTDPLPSAGLPYPPPRYQPPGGGSRSTFLGCAFALSFLGNLLAGVVILFLCFGLLFKGDFDSTGSTGLPEKYHSGSKTAKDKVAIVSIDTVLMEGLLSHVTKQLEQAGKDEAVKAVVLRIDSPGGSITASDDLHRKILALRDGDDARHITARPVLVSMGSVAASGGYYIAAPAAKIFAETSTITGSIGVYSSFPNIRELAGKVGVTMNTIKAGKIKDSGSPFREMSEEERQVVQDMVNDAYVQFLQVIEKGRPKLTRPVMLERFTVQPFQPDPKAGGKDVPAYSRYRADGGIYTAKRALDLGLIDTIGPLEDAVKAAAEAASLDSYRAIRYQRSRSLTDLLLTRTDPPAVNGLSLGVDRLSTLLTPRMWYLAPEYEAAAVLAGTNEQR